MLSSVSSASPVSPVSSMSSVCAGATVGDASAAVGVDAADKCLSCGTNLKKKRVEAKLSTKRGLVMTGDEALAALEQKEKMKQEVEAKKAATKKKRAANKAALALKREQIDARKKAREEKKREKEDSAAEQRMVRESKKITQNSIDSEAERESDQGKENGGRYVDIIIDTSALQHTSSSRILGEVQNTATLQSSVQHHVLNSTNRYEVVQMTTKKISLHRA